VPVWSTRIALLRVVSLYGSNKDAFSKDSGCKDAGRVQYIVRGRDLEWGRVLEMEKVLRKGKDFRLVYLAL